jgi:tRNA-2-methylthio-N6-dimethylallyladenosine synthase
MKRVHVETWGCQMNVADSEKMLSILAKEDYLGTSQVEEADLIILNTCHIREKARHKVVSRLGVLRELKKQKPGLTIAVTGCVAQAEGKKLLAEAPTIDLLIGPGKLHELGQMLQDHKATKTQQMAVGFAKPTYDEPTPEELDQMARHLGESLDGKNEASRFVTIQQGCDNFCTFCVVPFTRGREVSERPQMIQAKVKGFLKMGAQEITLLGQNVNSYGLDLVEKGLIPQSPKGPFVDLLESLCQIEDLKRLRITTSNPHDLTEPLARLYGKEPKLGKYFHLPVQSGSNRILDAMKRKVTREDYLKKVNWFWEGVPDMALSTDLIVGFPGETEEDFEETLDLVDKVRYRFVFAFMYSPRKNTPAQRFSPQVPEEIKAQRLARLHRLQDPISLGWHERQVGAEREVLFLYGSKKEPGIYYGRDEYFHLVRVPSSSNLVGQICGVKIENFQKTNLTGKLIYTPRLSR